MTSFYVRRDPHKDPPLPPEIAAITDIGELHRLEQQAQFQVQELATKRDAVQDEIERLVLYKIAINRRLIELLEDEFSSKPPEGKD